MSYDYVHLNNLLDISAYQIKPQRILVSSPQSAPVAPSLAMYRDPLTGQALLSLPRMPTEIN